MVGGVRKYRLVTVDSFSTASKHTRKPKKAGLKYISR